MLALPPALPVHAAGAIHSYAGWTAWQDVDPKAGE
jgi:hypothetical protein